MKHDLCDIEIVSAVLLLLLLLLHLQNRCIALCVLFTLRVPLYDGVLQHVTMVLVSVSEVDQYYCNPSSRNIATYERQFELYTLEVYSVDSLRSTYLKKSAHPADSTQ